MLSEEEKKAIKKVEEAKNIINELKDDIYKIGHFDEFDNCIRLENAIETVLQELKNKTEDNLQLVNLYKKTARKLKETGKDELADYFLAQIDAIPTFSIGSSYDQWIKISELEELYNQMKTCKTYREAYFMFEDFLLKKTEPKYPT